MTNKFIFNPEREDLEFAIAGEIRDTWAVHMNGQDGLDQINFSFEETEWSDTETCREVTVSILIQGDAVVFLNSLHDEIVRLFYKYHFEFDNSTIRIKGQNSFWLRFTFFELPVYTPISERLVG